MTDPTRVAVVTGGASGIGLGIARHLLGRGMAVVIADVDEDACVKLRMESEERLRIVTADVGTEEGARAAIEAASGEFGRVDLLCNNAGVHPIATVEELDVARIRQQRARFLT